MSKINNKQRRIQYQEKYQREFSNNWFKFCREPLENIEGWDKMLNDRSDQCWHLHHRDEIKEGIVVSREELISRGVYYNLTPDKLIFLTESEHMSMHNTGKTLSEKTKKKISEKKIGKQNPMYGKTGDQAPMYGRNKYGITKEDLHELYVVQGLTQEKVAEKYGCKQSRISRKLKKFGIKRPK